MTTGEKTMLKKRYVAVGVTVALLCCSGCSGDNNQAKTEQQADKGRVETLTDQAANQAAEAIRQPMDRAQVARNLGSAHVEDLAQQMEEENSQ
jgi:hypothetical protein